MDSEIRQLKYPVLMVHGMGFRDTKLINYWGRIPKELEKLGCKIYYGYQDSNASIETNAQHIKKRIEEVLAETGAEKVNIIAHSKGGLDTRYAISTLGMGDKVVSLTTMSTPHNGSKTMDIAFKLPHFLLKFGSFFADVWFRILGDKKPETYKAIKAFTRTSAAEFNANNPDLKGIYYQSYAFVMKHPFSDIFMWFPSLVVGLIEGENDGLLTPDAVRWTNFKGIQRGNSGRGISHCDEVDMRRFRLTKKQGDGVSDIVNVYKEAVGTLLDMGF